MGDVGYAPLDQQTISNALKSCPPGEPVRMTMNSGGGDAFAGEAIRAMLATAECTVECTIAGMCASAAVTIAMGCDVVRMTSNSALMIHGASTAVSGNAAELSSRLQLLETLDAGMVALFVARTGRSEKVVQAWLAAETWFTAEEALAVGLIDEVVPAIASASFSLPATAPERIRAALDAQVRVVQAPPMAYPATLLTKLGLAADATDEQVLAALDAAMAAQAQLAVEPPAATVAPAVPALTAADVARIVGEQLAAQRAAAEASASPDVIAQAHAAAAASAVERFISEGKISPAARAQALAACGKDVNALNAAVAYWTAASPVIASAAKFVAPTAESTANAKLVDRLLKDSGITKEQYAAAKGLRS